MLVLPQIGVPYNIDVFHTCHVMQMLAIADTINYEQINILIKYLCYYTSWVKVLLLLSLIYQQSQKINLSSTVLTSYH